MVWQHQNVTHTLIIIVKCKKPSQIMIFKKNSPVQAYP